MAVAVVLAGLVAVAGCATSPAFRVRDLPGHATKTARSASPSTTAAAPSTTVGGTVVTSTTKAAGRQPTTTVHASGSATPATTVPPAPAPPASSAPVAPGSRAAWQWPFSSTSIWNMPIGSSARYVASGLRAPGAVGTDDVYLVRTTSADPVRPVYDSINHWSGGRCTPDKMTSPPLYIRVPDSFYVPDASGGNTPNSIATFLDPDGRTLRGLGVVARCLHDANGRSPGEPGYGAQPIDYNLYAVPNEQTYSGQDLYGDGIYGNHGGSSLSGIGGHLRTGELTGSGPIRHALAVGVWGQEFLNYDRSAGGDYGQLRGPGYRWPALHADSYASESDGYHGSNPAMVMGSLLAVPPGVTADSLGLQSDVGRKLFAALQTYGAYIVDDTYWDDVTVGIDTQASAEFRSATGHDFGDGPEGADLRRIVTALSVVDNNGPSTVGGGGSPLVALAPAIG